MEKETKIVNIDYNFTDLKLYFEKFKEKQENDYKKNKTYSIEVSSDRFPIFTSIIMMIIGIIGIIIFKDSTFHFLNITESGLYVGYILFGTGLVIFFAICILKGFFAHLSGNRSYTTIEKSYPLKEYFSDNFDKYLNELSLHFNTKITKDNIIKNKKGIIINPNLITKENKAFWYKAIEKQKNFNRKKV